MNAKEAIESIKKLVFGEENPTPEPAPEVFGTEYKLADGTPIMIDKLEVGGIAKLGDMVAPDGTHYLEDGTSFEIKDGLIASVTPKEEKPEIEIEMGKKLEQMAAQFEAIQEEVKTLKGEFAKVTVKAETQQKANEELVKLVEFLAEEPAANPIKPEVKFEEMTPLERFRFNKELQRQN